MPYRYRKLKRSNPHCVQKKDSSGKWVVPSSGWCHKTKEEALKHLAALKSNVEDSDSISELLELYAENDILKINNNEYRCLECEEGKIMIDNMLGEPLDGRLVFYNPGSDFRRVFPNSTMAFCAEIPRVELSQDFEKNKLGIFKKGSTYFLRHEVTRTGEFAHPWYGLFEITLEKLAQMKENFDKNILGQGIAFNIAHDHSKGALGWHEELQVVERPVEYKTSDGETKTKDGISLVSTTELTDPFGRSEIAEAPKKFRYTSAEIMWDMEDVEVHREFKEHGDEEEEEDGMNDDEDDDEDKKVQHRFQNVLVGSAATNIPFIPRLTAYEASSDHAKDIYFKLLNKYGSPLKVHQMLAKELKARGLLI